MIELLPVILLFLIWYGHAKEAAFRSQMLDDCYGGTK